MIPKMRPVLPLPQRQVQTSPPPMIHAPVRYRILNNGRKASCCWLGITKTKAMRRRNNTIHIPSMIHNVFVDIFCFIPSSTRYTVPSPACRNDASSEPRKDSAYSAREATPITGSLSRHKTRTYRDRNPGRSLRSFRPASRSLRSDFSHLQHSMLLCILQVCPADRPARSSYPIRSSQAAPAPPAA